MGLELTLSTRSYGSKIFVLVLNNNEVLSIV